MYKEDLALNSPQWLICHKTKTKFFRIQINKYIFFKLINFAFKTKTILQSEDFFKTKVKLKKKNKNKKSNSNL